MHDNLPDAALRWRCRRGMLELDVLLQRFLADGYATLDRAGKARFAQLLEMEDDRLWRWLGGAVTPAAAGMADIVERIRICR